MSALLKGVVRNGRVELDGPIDWPDGTEVVVASSGETQGDGVMTPAEIERLLKAMQLLEPLEIPDDVAADLDAWERQLDRYSVDHADAESHNVPK